MQDRKEINKELAGHRGMKGKGKKAHSYDLDESSN